MMRRFILVLLTLMLALPAFAESSPVFSQEALHLQTANQALEARYGLSPAILGLFDAEVTCYGDAAAVRYVSHPRPHPLLAGEYLVLISGDEVQAFWTHDDVDPAIWQSGALTSPAWGAPQLLAYLQTDSFEREYFDAPYIPAEDSHQWNGYDLVASGMQIFESRSGALTDAEIALPAALGRLVVKEMYSMSDAAAKELRLINVTLYRFADGCAQWRVNFYHNAEPDEANYNVLIDVQTQEILSVSVFTGGIG